ncbi:MAG: TonB family protein [Alistipes sp.]|nr:TonB family protein [Alistipes sp.]
MTDFFIYLSYSTLSLAALYLLYKVLMSYETLHRLNRVLLLGFVVLSAVLPLCRIEVVEELPAVEPVEFVAPMTDSVVYEVAESFNYTALLQMAFFVLFLLGVVVMIARLVISIMSVKRIISSGERQYLEGGVTLTIVDKPISPFSWFGHIVVSRADIEQNRDIILTHEMAHIRLRHSWDVLAVDLALCFWWFNPAMWLLRRELQSLHEYQADDAVLNSGIDAQTYQLLLIKRAVGSRLHSVANCLNHSNLNKRITMMCKKTSSRWSAAKALLVLPLVAVSLAATATTVYVSREVQDKVTENSVNDKSVKTQVVKISKSGIYLNGEKITIEELKAKVAEWDTVTIEADKNVKMGDVAELKEALRENGTLKVNYLVSENEPKQNKKASAEEAPVAEEKERVATVSEQPKDVATIVVKENKKYLYNGKEIKDESELMRLLEEYECETINVVLETTNTTPLLLHILPKVAKNVNYKYMLVKENPISNDENVVKELTAHIKGFLQQIPNKPASVFVTSVDIKVGRLGAVTVEKITTSRDISSDRNAQVVYSRVKELFEHYYNGKLIPKEPVKLHFDVVFAKSVNGELIYDDVPLGDNAVWVIGYDENVADANVHGRVIDAKTKKQVPNVAVLIKEKSIGVFADESGQYIIKGQPEGIYTLIASTVGYKSAEKSVSIAPDKNVEVNFELEENVVSLNEVTVSSDTKVAEANAKAAAAKVQEAANAQATAAANATTGGDMPYVKVEKMPTFMGGDLNVFRNWVQSKIQYPKEAMDKGIKGRVVCSFVVEKDGSLTEFDVLQSPDKSLADEVVRILKTSPKWESGEQRGEKVRVKYTVPIVFSIAD